MISLIIGYILDLIIGDPHGFFHPIKLIGNMISTVEKKLRTNCKNKDDERRAGTILWMLVVGTSFVVPYLILVLASSINLILAITLESVMCYYILATKSLRDESMKVYKALKENNIVDARKYLSYIVGRDTENLNESSVAKGAVETVAENTSDGVIAPIIFILIGGAPLGFMYKAINTLDSMVGYKNEKYIDFGRISAISDDVANYLPSRISAYLMIIASMILGMDSKNAYKIYKRDRYNHLSPNSAQTESVCAGALNISLGGGNYYGGILVSKQTIGDDDRPIEAEDIKKANNLMYLTSFICLILGIVIVILF
ncbi:adenosylcobinamide-phosphate synthase [Sedimentibacter acidaminivorans]|uniref:Cobalamin biosynthesis protein CobD n=1 Tax=Sedimentibacter acidaminivorans TaxID=913099 RepID=A0ABS4GBM2_9FIRM|nr:adenosylcobinamide-phosphate synthase CbiB [Sedimentibacter acidaminivorans]MBP1925067.1 adenosylcobinamide-phosphate synthase [Sedimentibacter acidaminivorans]